MRILALEPFYGGSHQAFLEGWSSSSQHQWEVLTLPAHNWKWRMRHSAITFAEIVRQRVQAGAAWDLVFCSDMLDLAGFNGLAHPAVSSLPKVVYFHENQLTYPVRHQDARDYHFGLTNITTCLAADAIWFNTSFHRLSFMDAVETLLKKMTDHQPLHALPHIQERSTVFPQGIDDELFTQRVSPRKPGPLRILWAARWEYDKNPEDFFSALNLIKQQGIPFRISVLGENFSQSPSIFAVAEKTFSDHIDHWGFQPSREEYHLALQAADVAVSTAHHEFFGVGLVEAVFAGAIPLAPTRLAYPEVFNQSQNPGCFYDGSVEDLSRCLGEWAREADQGVFTRSGERVQDACFKQFAWSHLRSRLDEALSAAL